MTRRRRAGTSGTSPAGVPGVQLHAQRKRPQGLLRRPQRPGHDNYLTDVLSSLAASFISDTVQNDPQQPFFLEVATFAPHQPYTPAPKYAHLYPALQYPRKPSFDAPSTNPPAWLRGRSALTTTQLAAITKDFRLRAEDVKSVDDMVGAIVATLRSVGALTNTYFVFSSDNGYHMGEHRLAPGKLTAFDTDIRVPLIVVGPGVPGYQAPWFAQNIDLRSTFDALAGTSPPEPIDGRSLVPLLSLATEPAVPPDWPEGALVEHRAQCSTWTTRTTRARRRPTRRVTRPCGSRAPCTSSTRRVATSTTTCGATPTSSTTPTPPYQKIGRPRCTRSWSRSSRATTSPPAGTLTGLGLMRGDDFGVVAPDLD